MAALSLNDVFRVGADYFGVSDLEGLAKDTHKFESRYLDQLVGPYPEMKATYTQTTSKFGQWTGLKAAENRRPQAYVFDSVLNNTESFTWSLD